MGAMHSRRRKDMCESARPMHQIDPVLVSWTKALAMQGQQRRKARGRPHVRVQRQGAVDGVDGGVELGAQPGIAAAAHRPLDLHRCCAALL